MDTTTFAGRIILDSPPAVPARVNKQASPLACFDFRATRTGSIPEREERVFLVVGFSLPTLHARSFGQKLAMTKGCGLLGRVAGMTLVPSCRVVFSPHGRLGSNV
jgi:hypothetical protein